MARLSSALVLLAAGVAAASPTKAVKVAPTTVSGTADMHDGCIHMQIVHSTNTNYFGKRAVELALANRSDVAYYAKLSFGTPAQPQFVQLDTGSFELWLNPTCDGLSLSDASFCEAVGNFNTSNSSTITPLNETKVLQYGIGSANISYVRDSIGLPGTTSVLKQVQFGVASSTSDEFAGILGIGFGQGLTTNYANFVDELTDQNITQVRAFSLALGSKDEQEGVVVFGGVDTSKFSGTLARVPIIPAAQSPDGVPRYWVNMSSVSLTAGKNTESTESTGSSKTTTKTATKTSTSKATASTKAVTSTYANSSMAVFLDSGSTLTLLPAGLADSIAADFGVVDGPSSSGFYYVDCSYASANGTLNFAFPGVSISVPFHELVRQSGSQCMLGIQASSQFALLGDTFLRSAYVPVVIDQTDNDIWMAQYTNCGSTPAALATTQSLVALTGDCSPGENIIVVTTTPSIPFFSPTTSSSATAITAVQTAKASASPSPSTSSIKSAAARTAPGILHSSAVLMLTSALLAVALVDQLL
ncbi:candidapepsin-4 precursor [Grosmannia clavigera kw1407]|uniref:Candidapepsin-4 n=1 Tax=Grosmannia clavigera (strain kw1407 / UAMH 11150) TaxID=655863 RepID=F0XR37_GROCL|nr:candidapepsin-4 precursor [Grosmannia clavigera kw1407]EFW99931.1 candidapepsin-4 precursor [Grosmannia clavigera kw1407]